MLHHQTIFHAWPCLLEFASQVEQPIVHGDLVLGLVVKQAEDGSHEIRVVYQLGQVRGR